MKKVMIYILILTSIIYIFTACDLLNPAALDQILDNPVDSTGTNYSGVISEDTDGDGIGDYMDSDEVLIITPVNQAVVASFTPELVMKPKSPDISGSYGFIVSANSDVSNPVLTKSGLTAPSYTVETMLENNTVYYWQAVFTDKDGAQHKSGIQTFSISVYVPLDAPILTSPVNGSTPNYGLSSLTLDWEDVADADSYELQIQNVTFAQDETDLLSAGWTSHSCSVSSKSWTSINDALSNNDGIEITGKNYWRVRSVSGSEQSE